MRNALLIGLMVMGVAGAAQAQSTYKPYQPPKPGFGDRDPYDLPKSYQTNPYNRDYSKNPNDTAAYKNTYENQRNDGYSNGYGANRGSSSNSSSGSSGFGSSRSTGANRDTSRCKPGLVC